MITSNIARTIWSTSIRHRSDAEVSDRRSDGQMCYTVLIRLATSGAAGHAHVDLDIYTGRCRWQDGSIYNHNMYIYTLAEIIIEAPLVKYFFFQFRVLIYFEVCDWGQMVWNYHIFTVVVGDMGLKINFISANKEFLITKILLHWGWFYNHFRQCSITISEYMYENLKYIWLSTYRWASNLTNWYFDRLVQDGSNSIANALELLQSRTKPSICSRHDMVKD